MTARKIHDEKMRSPTLLRGDIIAVAVFAVLFTLALVAPWTF